MMQAHTSQLCRHAEAERETDAGLISPDPSKLPRSRFLKMLGAMGVLPTFLQAQREQQLSSPKEIKTMKKIKIQKNGSVSSVKGPHDWFTGVVRIDPLFQAETPARVGGASVTFEPGARTAWHTHPLGQTLIVTSGSGRVQQEDGPIEEIHPGDVVWFPPGVKHWHGASPTHALTHIAIQESLDGKAVDWLEHVSDEQYNA